MPTAKLSERYFPLSAGKTGRFIIIIAILVAALFSHCADSVGPSGGDDSEFTVSEKRLVEAGNAFSLELFTELNKEETGENLFISPLSVSYALGMTYNGADGETREAMERVLGFSGMSIEEVNRTYKHLMELLMTLDPKVVLEIANSIWYRQGEPVREEFVDVNKRYFDALVQALNFSDPASVDIINGWVSDKTHGLIDEVIEEINPNIIMFLINALYFKGTWLHEFDPDHTAPAPFFLADGSRIDVPMMTQKSEFHYYSNNLFQAIDLPYGNEKFSMTVFLPRAGIDIDNLLAEINNQTWNSWINDFPEEKTDVTVYMPKFEIEYEKSLVNVLKAMGMGIAFTEEADFSKISHMGGLSISDVIHFTYINVDEEGTEAAAVTVVIVERDSIGNPVMRLDRPFFFVIRENQNDTILFMGKIMNPLAD